MRHAFRDFFRRRRIARHVAEHGDRYIYHGLDVEAPTLPGQEATSLGVRNALLRRKYERDEAVMILKHLPADLPVIELGGSLGVVSRLVRSRLKPDVPHLIVEANADLIAICAANASKGAASGATEVVYAAVFHDGPVARFRIGRDVHSNALDGGVGGGRVREVPAVTLSDLLDRLHRPDAYALVSDIEGAEYAIFEREAEALAGAKVAILEIHPGNYAKRGGSEAAFMDFAKDAGFRLADRQADVVVLVRD